MSSNQEKAKRVLRAPIGEPLGKIVEHLTNAGNELISLLDLGEVFFVDDLLTSLQAQVCSIAVIG
ncbi:MAG: hypothetical protein SGJ17_03960 [Hyphomicrobiales bacterium]|nr:hypothetical protein [Hyphomicrobiales bacterium]